MGLLSLGTPLPWEEAKKYADHVRTHGVTQFLNTWARLKDRQGDELFWGDEVYPSHWWIFDLISFHKVEYIVVVFDSKTKNTKISLRQTEILQKLQSIVDDIRSDCCDS
jgi:glutamate--cysteine ligase catalytic subunit